MKSLLLLGVILTASLVLAQDPPPPPPPPTDKHPFKQCLETYNTCVQNAGDEWEPQQACFLGFYECQNIYTRKCRKLYRNQACYEILGKDECWKKLRACYGSSNGDE
ncbi:hypothetical protein ACROYT_G021054 [Oculina patagonica]